MKSKLSQCEGSGWACKTDSHEARSQPCPSCYPCPACQGKGGCGSTHVTDGSECWCNPTVVHVGGKPK